MSQITIFGKKNPVILANPNAIGPEIKSWQNPCCIIIIIKVGIVINKVSIEHTYQYFVKRVLKV